MKNAYRTFTAAADANADADADADAADDAARCAAFDVGHMGQVHTASPLATDKRISVRGG